MPALSNKRKIALLIILTIVIAAHVALFVAGGSYRTLAEVLLVVDVISAFFIVGAVKEFRKLDQK
jgi:hypothetical protein